ncbi:MAG TPA: acetyl-CoA carboxylase carboxyltransferase subunit alpha [Spirochaetes bacterium]|nr:acetyl-CoA carboxylase carboxyltransferase subunit alpha [Spirochaetota bacterium]
MAVELGFEGSVIEMDNQIKELAALEAEGDVSFQLEIQNLTEKRDNLLKEIYNNLTPWQIVQVARHPKRPLFSDYIDGIFKGFIELHGDRNFGDDQSIIAGICTLEEEKVFIIGHQRGRDMKDNVKRNFGMPKPEGYRKALRVMKLAEKFNKPIITFIDTKGAYPGIEAEQRGQSEAIARNLFEMSKLKVPIICVVIGEGGSGGALALGVGDRLLMLSYSMFSVISPEGCATILWKDAGRAPEAANALRITAQDLLSFGLIDESIEEPLGGAHRNPELMTQTVKEILITQLKGLKRLSIKRLLDKRYEKFMGMGQMFKE